jgi:transcriptional regulator of acetoin/glycerol metabolism
MVRTAEPTISGDAPQRAPELDAGDALIVLLVCDDPIAGSTRHALAELDEVVIRRAAARCATRSARRLELAVPDPRMSQLHARFVRELTRWVVEDAGSKNGVRINGTRHQRAALSDGDVLQLGHTFFLFRAARPAAARYPVDCDRSTAPAPLAELATFLPGLAAAFDDLAVVARTGAAILISGQTGTGKELVARAVHAFAGRTGSFVAVNCGALPETLAESELFGFRKGAFSGATQDRLGLIRSADRGTLFLDEIGDLALGSQATLLRVLQEREVCPVGSSEPVAVDLQVVAATHHDLDALIAQGRFRRDLHARLAAFTLRLPALRDRVDDLGLLIAELLARMPRGDGGPVRFTADAAAAVLCHDWPSNIRELAACLVVSTALARGEPVRPEHLPEAVRGAAAARADAPDRTPEPAAGPAGDDRRAALIALLVEHRGNISAVARAAKRSRVQIHRLLRRFAIDAERFRR